MNRKELIQAGQAMFGRNWKGPLAAFLNVNRRMINRCIAADFVPQGPAEDIRNAPALRTIGAARRWAKAFNAYQNAANVEEADRTEADLEAAEDDLLNCAAELESTFPDHVGELVDAALEGVPEDA